MKDINKMQDTVKQGYFKEVLLGLIKWSKEREKGLSEIDRAYGDGDHGKNLAAAFSELKVQFALQEIEAPDALFIQTGMTLMDYAGGMSGVLYGCFFLKMGQFLKTHFLERLEKADYIQMITIGIEAVKKCSGKKIGDKTLLDALIPAEEAMQAAYQDGKALKDCMKAAQRAAEEGVEKSKDYVAKEGKTTAFCDQGRGCQDPGATSAMEIIGIFAQNLV